LAVATPRARCSRVVCMWWIASPGAFNSAFHASAHLWDRRLPVRTTDHWRNSSSARSPIEWIGLATVENTRRCRSPNKVTSDKRHLLPSEHLDDSWRRQMSINPTNTNRVQLKDPAAYDWMPLRGPKFQVPPKPPRLTSTLGWKSLSALVALSLLVFTAVTALAQDSCSGRKTACDNICWQRSGAAQVECNEYCKKQLASCLRTGVFKTRGGDYSGLQKK
jgi:hypothetical protein